jgi:hypothetical protein
VSPLGPDYPAAGLKRDASLPFADKNSLSRRMAEYTLSPLSFKACPDANLDCAYTGGKIAQPFLDLNQ